jgi:long-chain acyl-CoA synthetase
MKVKKSLFGVARAFPSLLMMEETRGLGKTIYKQWGGAGNTLKILGKAVSGGDGLISNLKNLARFKVGRIVPNMIVGMWESFPDREAIVDGDKRYTFGAMKGRVFRLANALKAMGVQPREAVAVMVYNSAEFLEVFWGVSLIGGTMPFVNFHLKGEELATTINLRQPKVLFFDAEFLPEITAVKDELAYVERFVVVGAEVVPEGMIDYEELIASNADSWPDVNFIVALNPYTGGTTGTPKSSNFFDSVGYMLTDLAEPPRVDLKSFLKLNIRAFGFFYYYGGTEIFDPVGDNIRSLIVTPLYHAGTIAGWAPFILMGATAVVMRKFDPEEFLRLIQEERINWTFVAPTILQRVLALPEEVKAKYDLSSMHSIICAAAPCPPRVKRDINELFKRQGAVVPVFNEYYGSAETAMVTVLLPEDYLENPKRIESVGKARCGDMRILREAGGWAAPGEVGKVMSRSATTVSLRYPGSEHKLHESLVIIDGEEWFDDGLLGYVDDDGFLFLTGREKEMIITGGVNLYPAEIEAVLLLQEAVFDAAAIRIPHPDLGEVPLACVQLHQGKNASEEEIIEFCKEQGLHGYKVPARVDFFDELPRHIDGKIIKRELEALYWKDVQAGG